MESKEEKEQAEKIMNKEEMVKSLTEEEEEVNKVLGKLESRRGSNKQVGENIKREASWMMENEME